MKLRKLSLLPAAATLALAAPVYAQMPGHNMPGMTMPMPAKPAAKKASPAKKKAVPAKKAGKKAAPAKAVRKSPAKRGAKAAASPMAPGHDMSTMPGMTMPQGSSQPQATMPAGHDMGAMPATTEPAQPMSSMPGHDMGTMAAPEAAGTDLPAGNEPPPPVPVANAADAFYGREAMEMGRDHLRTFHGGQKLFQAVANILEYRAGSGRDGYGWDAEGWYGGDINRLWIKSEGEGELGRSIEKAEVQALYSHAVDPYFNVQGGIRYDVKPNPSRVYATVALEGLAPSFFDVEGALFLSNKGELMARAEGYYDQRITQRLILQPRAELNFAAQSSREIGVGKGLSDTELGLRLRYDIRREFAPYVGVQWRRAFGDTRRFLREAGEDAGGWEFVAGVRTWF